VHTDERNVVVDTHNESKRFADSWLQASDAIDCDDLAALVDALDCLKKDAQQKLSLKKATRAGMTADSRSGGSSGANQGVRRSSRLKASIPRSASSASLFVAEHETESESGDDYHEIPPTAPDEASFANYTTATATAAAPSEIPFGDLLWASETPIENIHEIEVVQSRHALELEPSSPMLYRVTPVVHEQDELAYVQPARVFSEASASHQPHWDNTQSGVDTLHQTAQDVRTGRLHSEAECSRQVSLHQPFPDPAESDVSISPACDMEVENSDSDEMVMQDASTPQFFNEAFEDLYGSSLQHESQIGGEEITVACQKQYPTDPTHTPSLSDDLVFQSYLDLACRASFRLPHESAEDADSTKARELLSPLVEGTPLTPRLLHGLIYLLVPGPLRILEVDPIASDGGMLADESLTENFAVILRESEEALPLLVLGTVSKKTLFVLSSGAVNFPFLSALYRTLPEWKTEYIEVANPFAFVFASTDFPQPHGVSPHVESTLLSVWIAEACFQGRPLRDAPSSRELRLRFLEELLAPVQRDSVLEQYGISSKLAVSQQIDIRLAETRSEAQLQSQPQSNEVFVSKLETFDLEALHEALLQKPADMSCGRCLRILQCVYEIGSPCILDSLKPTFTTKREDQARQAMEQPVVEKLFRIHLYLDSQESESHLLVARSRYVKYCYFETYLLAVAALQREKRNSSREKRRVHARKLTASFKQGLCDELPPTPHDDEIHRIYEDLSPSEKKRRAQDMVKNEISRKVAKEHGIDEKRVRRNINRYIRQGRVLHCVLQGGLSLNPGLLVLFPSSETHAPSLSTAEFGVELSEPEEKSLSRPIEIKE
jgi:hypothetical protein